MSGSHLHPTFKEAGAVVVGQDFLADSRRLSFCLVCPLHSHHFAEGFPKQLGYLEICINLAEYALIKMEKSSTPSRDSNLTLGRQ